MLKKDYSYFKATGPVLIVSIQWMNSMTCCIQEMKIYFLLAIKPS